MTQSRQIEKELFESAIDLAEPSARTAFLNQACSGNPDIRNRIEKLLAVHASAEEFFRVRPVHLTGGAAGPDLTFCVAFPHVPGPADTLGSASAVIGRYTLLRRLGEGGCGVVYEAEQGPSLRRRVALKIIRLGMDTEKVIARFEAERQALAHSRQFKEGGRLVLHWIRDETSLLLMASAEHLRTLVRIPFSP